MRLVIPAAFLVGVLFGAGAWASAQVVILKPAPTIVLTGANIGFRMVAFEGTTAVGQLVVRVDGQWVDTAPAMGFRPAVAK